MCSCFVTLLGQLHFMNSWKIGKWNWWLTSVATPCTVTALRFPVCSTENTNVCLWITTSFSLCSFRLSRLYLYFLLIYLWNHTMACDSSDTRKCLCSALDNCRTCSHMRMTPTMTRINVSWFARLTKSNEMMYYAWIVVSPYWRKQKHSLEPRRAFGFFSVYSA